LLMAPFVGIVIEKWGRKFVALLGFLLLVILSLFIAVVDDRSIGDSFPVLFRQIEAKLLHIRLYNCPHIPGRWRHHDLNMHVFGSDKHFL
jgi:hypothetical protein